MRDVVIATYSQQPELARFAHDILDIPYRRAILKKWSRFYVADLMKIEADWIVHLDEDAFVYKPARVEGLIDYMDANGFACCGVPDGGVIPVRVHNPVGCNPFFSIINRRLLLRAYHADGCSAYADWQDSYRSRVSHLVQAHGGAYAFDGFEPYYGFYFWLCKHGFEILYLDAQQWTDEPEQISTVVMDHDGVPFLLHSWYARRYKTRIKRWPLGLPIVRRLRSSWTYKQLDGPHYCRIQRAMEAALAMKLQEAVKPRQGA